VLSSAMNVAGNELNFYVGSKNKTFSFTQVTIEQ